LILQQIALLRPVLGKEPASNVHTRRQITGRDIFVLVWIIQNSSPE